MTRHQFFALTNIGYCWCGWTKDSTDWAPPIVGHPKTEHLVLMEEAFRDHLTSPPPALFGRTLKAAGLCHATIDATDGGPTYECARDIGHAGRHKDLRYDASWSNRDTHAHKWLEANGVSDDDENRCESYFGGLRCKLVVGHAVIHGNGELIWDNYPWDKQPAETPPDTMPTCPSISPHGARCKDDAGHDGQHSDGDSVWET